MQVLVLGGGSFVGGALVREARARGWGVTCLSRGSAPLPAGVRTIVADRRDAGAVSAALAGQRPDLVVDTWAAEPSAVVTSARAVAAGSCRYGYVSSRSVYAGFPDGADETSPVVEADPDAGRTDYAADKRGGELAAERELGADRVIHLRAGAILGPGENHGRLPWWLGRMARGGAVLAPGPAELALQYVDVRDLARLAWDALSDGRSGPVDVVSPSGHATTSTLLHACREVTASTAQLVWVDADWLLEHGVRAWTELPVWAPPQSEAGGLHRSDVTRALSWGLRCRPVEETVTDTWASIRAGDTPAEPVVPGLGIAPDVEARLLAEWGRTG